MSRTEMTNQQNTLAQRGMQVREPTPTLMEGLNRIGTQMVEEWLATAGEDGRRVIEAYRRA
jgi:hypothetical protein